MCLALPAEIVARGEGDEATVDLGGVRKSISLALTPTAQVGDFVIVHVGFAIGMMDTEEAKRTLALFAEIPELVANDAQQENLAEGKRQNMVGAPV